MIVLGVNFWVLGEISGLWNNYLPFGIRTGATLHQCHQEEEGDDGQRIVGHLLRVGLAEGRPDVGTWPHGVRQTHPRIHGRTQTTEAEHPESECVERGEERRRHDVSITMAKWINGQMDK